MSNFYKEYIMNTINKVAVLGGGGRTGNYLVSQLLQEGFSVKLLLRNPENPQQFDETVSHRNPPNPFY